MPCRSFGGEGNRDARNCVRSVEVRRVGASASGRGACARQTRSSVRPSRASRSRFWRQPRFRESGVGGSRSGRSPRARSARGGPRTFPPAGAAAAFSGSAAAATISLVDHASRSAARGRGSESEKPRWLAPVLGTSRLAHTHRMARSHMIQEKNRVKARLWVLFFVRALCNSRSSSFHSHRDAPAPAATMVLPLIGSDSFPRTKRFDARDRLALVHNAKRRTTGVRPLPGCSFSPRR